MYLNQELLMSITFGSVDTTEDADGFHFCKLTKKQVAVWDKERPDLGDNGRALTGVVFDLETDSRHFSFDMNIRTQVDIYIDGLFVRCDTDTSHVSVELDGQMRRVTVYLPGHGPAPAVRNVWIDDGAVLRPHAFDRKILFIGDSITQGWESVYNGVRYDSMTYANILSRHLNAESVVQGIGGAYFLPASADELPFDPDMVIVALGTNDFWVFGNDYEVIGRNAAEFLRIMGDMYADKPNKPDRKLFCLSPIWSDRGAWQPAFLEFCEKLKETISQSRFTLIDGFSLVPHNSEFFADGVLHPNALGFYMFADNLLKAIEPSL